MSTYTEDFNKKIIEAVEAYKKETKGNAAARAYDLGFFLVRDKASDEASETYSLYPRYPSNSLTLCDHCSLEKIEAFLDAVERINNGLLDD